MHLQLIKFWRFCAPGKGVCSGGDFRSALLQPARSVCVSLSAFCRFKFADDAKLVGMVSSPLEIKELQLDFKKCTVGQLIGKCCSTLKN